MRMTRDAAFFMNLTPPFRSKFLLKENCVALIPPLAIPNLNTPKQIFPRGRRRPEVYEKATRRNLSNPEGRIPGRYYLEPVWSSTQIKGDLYSIMASQHRLRSVLGKSDTGQRRDSTS